MQAHEEMRRISNEKFQSILEMMRTIGDILPSFKGSELAVKLFKIEVKDSLAWFGGLVSALVACYQLY